MSTSSLPQPPAASGRGNACAVTPGQRAARGVLALLVGAVGVAAAHDGQLWLAVPAGVFATFLVIGAVTGWCPTNLLRPREHDAIGAAHGYPDARRLVRLGGTGRGAGGGS